MDACRPKDGRPQPRPFDLEWIGIDGRDMRCALCGERTILPRMVLEHVDGEDWTALAAVVFGVFIDRHAGCHPLGRAR